jgi:hypothetical protein
MLTVFFDSEGVVHYEFLPQGRTVNKEYYLEVIQRLRETVRKKRPDAWRENRWMFQHDNTPSHSSFLVRDFLAKHATTVLPQPPYSPDLAPADFFFFSFFKATVKSCGVVCTEAIKPHSLAHLRSIPNTAFQECFRTLKKRWQLCIQSRGEYSSCLYRASAVSNHFLLFHNDAHNYKITGILKQLKFRRSL